MKKILAVILALLLVAAVAAGCGQSAPSTSESAPAESASATESASLPESEPAEEATTIRLGGLTGPTTMGMVQLLAAAEKGETDNTYEFTLAAAADELTPKLVKGELDIAAVPVNLASILYNNTEGKVKMLAVNTLGVIYIVEKGGETVNSIADLKGKTIYATGKGTTPEYALTYLLQQNGLDIAKDVTMEWKSEPAETVAAMAAADSAVAMLPQPYVTVAQGKVEGLRVALDLTEEWNKLDNGSMFLTAGLIVRTEFAEKYPQQLAKFLAEYKASTEYANTNVAETAALIEKYGIVKAAIAEKALPYCNIVYIDGAEMKTAVSGYLQVLFDQNPKSIGGALPGDDFYYAK